MAMAYDSKHFLLIKVIVGPESNRTLSNFLDLIAEIVSTTMIVTGVRFVGTDFLVLSFCLSLPLLSDMAYIISRNMTFI